MNPLQLEQMMVSSFSSNSILNSTDALYASTRESSDNFV